MSYDDAFGFQHAFAPWKQAAEDEQVALNAARYEWIRGSASVDQLRSLIDLSHSDFDSYIDARRTVGTD